MSKYDHKIIEPKWQQKWDEQKLYKVENDLKKPKYYILDMFPYPSGEGLHIGHPKGYSATDIFGRMKTMQGYNVLHPMGWDAFGLPAENYALKNKTQPAVMNRKNIANFKKQIKSLGLAYDWDREIDTTDPKYYKWTQWIFLQMFKKGLAFESNEPIIWCPSCKTGLAQEDLENGVCERCGSAVERRPMRQWVLKITDYADRMLADLDKLPDWETSIKEMQRNWIGRSEGALVKFSISNFQFSNNDSISNDQNYLEVFTTRPDTLFGCTYMVVAPEHPILGNYKSQITNYKEIEEYQKLASAKSDLDRTDLAKDKTGVKIEGLSAINPVNGEQIPIFVADYVLIGYGTGAIMAVPAHDERDMEFAVKYSLPIKEVVMPVYGEFHEGAIERHTVSPLIQRKSDGKFLFLELKGVNKGIITTIIGGVEDGEGIGDAAVRETFEETGFQTKFKEKLGGKLESHFFAAHKNVWRMRIDQPVVLELIDENDDAKSVSGEEQALHDVLWLTEEEAMKKLSYESDLLRLKRYLNEGTAFSEDGRLVNSERFNGLTSVEARDKITAWLEEKGVGKKSVNYKLKDWVFSRQRYWGEPIPIVHCEKCGAVGVPESELPVLLPEVEHYEPSGTGESPLVSITDWVNTTCPTCGGPAKRETNTMPQWAGSSWYYLRYMDPHNDAALVDKEVEKYWAPVDFYVGGAEHATRHLIYARFWHKFLFDIGAVSTEEPFRRLQHVGLVLAEDGRKMSKRWGNVINPDDVVASHGADAVRMYEMFMGPFNQACAWSENGLSGVRRFLERVYNIVETKPLGVCDCAAGKCTSAPKSLVTAVHKTIKKVGEDIEEFKFNTAIAQMMILVNEMNRYEALPKAAVEKLLLVLAPFAPHLTEELWEKLGHTDSIFRESWPTYNPEKIVDEMIQLVVQVNGKLRDTLEVPADISEDEARKTALESENIRKWLTAEPKKVIFVKGKLINFVL